MVTVIIIFGFSGDLSKRMLIPALYSLFIKDKLNNFIILGASKDNLSVTDILSSAKEFIQDLEPTKWELFSKKVYYQQLDFKKINDFNSLKNYLNSSILSTKANKNILVYCSSSSDFFTDITKNCIKSGILKKQSAKLKTNWNRIVYEKPFGHDLVSACKINNQTKKLLNDFQIFRTDHFLAKEPVEDILYLRLANKIFESSWDTKSIESVAITLNESIDIEGRGSFYDSTGALLDMVQNHMLQILATICTEIPKDFNQNSINIEQFKDQKAKILKKVTFKDGLLGQYSGYTQEKNVNPNSSTETYVKLILNISTNRWKNTDFYLETGKALDKKNFSVTVKFRSTNSNFNAYHNVEPNLLFIPLQPDKLSNFVLKISTLTSLTRNSLNSLNDKQIDLTFPCGQTLPIPLRPYETIFQEIIAGNQAISISFGEIKSSWIIIDKIKKSNLPLYIYTKNKKFNK